MQNLDVAPPREVRQGPTHPDPYPYYVRLAAEEPVFRDEEHGFWVVSNAAAVDEVLASKNCLTAPLSARIPAVVAGGAMEKIFGQLVRLRDDDIGRTLKAALVSTLRGADLVQAAMIARAQAQRLGAVLAPQRGGDDLTRFLFAHSAAAIASLLGIADAHLDAAETALRDYGAAQAAATTNVPVVSPEIMARGHAGAEVLLALTTTAMRETRSRPNLLDIWVREATQAGCDEAAILGNAVGLMIQAYAATASLAGLTLLALARNPELRATVDKDRKALRPILAETLRCDPVTQSTFRFVAQDGTVAGHKMRQGDKIIVLLAGASRDPARNEDPQRFDIARPEPQSYGFGAGQHACPGNRLAPLIAEVAVDHLLTLGIELDSLDTGLTYAASAHIRTPLFHH